MKFDHILILVLEGVTTSRFEQEFLARPQGYYATLQDRSAYFAGYHTTNLDSYTSLIALLTSVQVPYRAYADPDSYARANDSPNLIAALGRRGFASLFVSTSQFAPFVPVPNNWTRTLTMRDLPQQERYLQVSGSKVEMGLEDRAAAPAILEFVSTHPRTIVMHEMLFGHSPRWMALTGQSQLEYEDAYLLELARGLEERGLLDRTLLIVVSDHGDRADSALAENYRVPLLISGQGIAPLHTSAFYSHNDFQQIVAHFLAGQPLPAARDSIMTVGSTERWVYGRITAAGESLFIDNDLGAELTRQGTLVARSLFESFQSHLNDFAARFQR